MAEPIAYTDPLSLFSLAGKRVLITGSSRGIGFALAKGLSAAGAEIVLNARGTEGLATAAATLREMGRTAHERPFDVTDEAATDTAIAAIEAELGAIDILVNNAGMTRRMPLHEAEFSVWREINATNLDSVFLVSRAVARHMIARERGKILNICSVQSVLARPNTAPYAATKGALLMLTKAMCADWAVDGLQINGLAPGYFVTELTQALADDAEFSGWLRSRTPAGRWGEVDELVGAAIFLTSDAGSFVNGQVVFVDGGITAVL